MCSREPYIRTSNLSLFQKLTLEWLLYNWLVVSTGWTVFSSMGNFMDQITIERILVPDEMRSEQTISVSVDACVCLVVRLVDWLLG